MFPKYFRDLTLALMAVISLGVSRGVESAELRTWTDATGQFTLSAKFVSIEGENVLLDRDNGDRMTIPLAKLSKADQEYVAKQKQNPFQSAGNSPFQPAAPRMGSSRRAAPVTPEIAKPAAPREVEVDWTRSHVILLDNNGAEWQVTPPEPFEFSPRPNPTALPPKRDFWEKLTNVAINPVAKKAVIGYKMSKPGSKDCSTRVVLCDVMRGETVETAVVEGEMAPLALHDNGQHIVMRSDVWGMGKQDRLEVWSIQNGQVVRSVAWSPYKGEWAGRASVVWAEFADEKTLITVGGGGKVALWDIGDIRPIRHFDLCDGAIPAVSADRKLLAFCGKDRVGLLDLTRRRLLCVQATPNDLRNPRMAFSPSGKRLACIADNQILVWDTATGELQQDFSPAGINIGGAIDFPNDEYLLGGNQYLIGVDTQIKLWHYKGAEYVRTLGGVTFMAVSPHNASGVLAATTVPHEQALALYHKAMNDPDIFVFRKGTTVKLNVSGVPGSHQGQVRDALTKKLQAMDCKIAGNADVEVVASVEGPKQKEVSYMHSGTYKVKEYRTSLKFLYRGTPAWQTSATNIPFMISLKKGENIEGKLRELGKQPSYGFYDRIALPEYLQKPSAGGGQGGGQTLGESQVTPRGFQ